MSDTIKVEGILEEIFSKTLGKVKYIAAYQTHNGKEFALERKKRKSEALPYYVWMEHQPPRIDGVEIRNLESPGRPYGKDQRRTTGLSGTTAPSLMNGNVAYYVKVRDVKALRELAINYEST